MDDRLLNAREAADFLDIHEDELEELVAQKAVAGYKIGGEFMRFNSAELARLKSTGIRSKKNISRAFTQDYQKPQTQDRIKDFVYTNSAYLLAVVIGIGAFVFLFKK